MSEELDSVVHYSVDLNEQEAPPPLPTGEYRGVVRAAEKKESQRGTMYAAVSFHISPDQYPADFADDANPDGMTLVYRRCSLEDNPQARYGARQFIEAIGGVLAKDVDVAEWVGLEGALEVEHDTFEGVTRAAIKRVRAA